MHLVHTITKLFTHKNCVVHTHKDCLAKLSKSTLFCWPPSSGSARTPASHQVQETLEPVRSADFAREVQEAAKLCVSPKKVRPAREVQETREAVCFAQNIRPAAKFKKHAKQCVPQILCVPLQRRVAVACVRASAETRDHSWPGRFPAEAWRRCSSPLKSIKVYLWLMPRGACRYGFGGVFLLFILHRIWQSRTCEGSSGGRKKGVV